MNSLTLRGVSKRFGGLVAVRDIDMDVAQSERRALIGPNGAGKTTLFNVIAGDLPATSGRINLFDKDITHMPVHKRVMLGLRRTYQTSALFNSLTVAENLYLGVMGPSRGHFNMVRLATRDRERMLRVPRNRRGCRSGRQTVDSCWSSLSWRAAPARVRSSRRLGAQNGDARRTGGGPLPR